MSRIIDLTKKLQNFEASAEQSRKQEEQAGMQAEMMEVAAEGIRLLIEKEGPVNGHDPKAGKKTPQVEKVPSGSN
jgi:hypothetical protein